MCLPVVCNIPHRACSDGSDGSVSRVAPVNDVGCTVPKTCGARCAHAPASSLNVNGRLVLRHRLDGPHRAPVCFGLAPLAFARVASLPDQPANHLSYAASPSWYIRADITVVRVADAVAISRSLTRSTPSTTRIAQSLRSSDLAFLRTRIVRAIIMVRDLD